MREKTGPKTSPDALLIIDVINDLEFAGGEKVLPWAKRMIRPLLQMRAKAHHTGVPVIYVNDNYGHWKGNFDAIYRHCTRAEVRGRTISRALKPTDRDYFVLKPRHSAFYCTSLMALLEDLHTRRVVLSGIATNLCVLFSAHDAHMQYYSITALSDCCAAESDHDHNWALDQLKRFCGARVCLSRELQLKRAQRRKRRSR